MVRGSAARDQTAEEQEGTRRIGREAIHGRRQSSGVDGAEHHVVLEYQDMPRAFRQTLGEARTMGFEDALFGVVGMPLDRVKCHPLVQADAGELISGGSPPIRSVRQGDAVDPVDAPPDGREP
jgi:hypothetical protein